MTKRIVRGAGGGGSGDTRTPIEAPDSLRSIAYAQIIDLISEGECQGWADAANPLRSYYLNETVVENADGTRNFNNLQIDTRFGTQTQDYIKGTDSVESEIGIGVELTSTTPWTRAVTNLNLSALRVRLSVLGLQKTNVKNGDITGYEISYKFEIATDGGAFLPLFTNSFNGKTSSTYERSHRISLPPAVTTGWIVRVTRLTANSDSATISDTTMVVSVTEIVDAKLRMPMSAVNSITIDASQFNAIPSRAHRWKGRIISVPSNYNPVTRIYTGVWDGTFMPAYTNNPAWVFYDMAINNRYGMGHIVSASLVDKWALYTIGVYCDGVVDDGKGGTEPRFTCNVYLQTRQDALRLMQMLATVFRGVMYASAGAITAVGDMPSDPVYTYTRANVIDGKFVYSGSARKVRHTVALVAWNNLNDFGRSKVEYIEDEEGIARYGVQQTEVIAIGSTSQGQARRFGKYLLAMERLSTQAVVFGVGLDGTFAAPGRIIHVADPLRAARRIGGRIRSYTLDGIGGSEVVVDHADTIVAGNTLICILPSGLPESRVITGVMGNTLLLAATTFSAAPAADSIWAVTSVSLTTQKYKVVGVMENPDGTGYTINAIEHVEGIYDFVELDIKVVVPPITAGVLLQPPAVITVSAYERVLSTLPTLVIVVEWTAVANAEKYEVSMQRNNGSWTAPVKVNTNRIEIEASAAGTYVASVSSISHRGFQSRPGLSAPTEIQTVSFTIVNDIASVAGVLTIDCSIAEQFRVTLFENITSTVFINVSSETTLIVEARNTASYTWAFPASVVPVSGVVYVPTAGGTINNPKIDTLGLHTDNAGVSWQLRVDYADTPATGGPGGAFRMVVAPNPGYVYAATSPSLALTATVSNGRAPITIAWTRAPGGIGNWGGSTDNAGGANFNFTSLTSFTPVVSRTGGANGYVAQNWRGTITDADGLKALVIVEITLEDDGVIIGGGGPQCAWREAWLPDGRQVKDVKIGSRIMGVDTVTLERKPLLVSMSKPAMANCYILFCADGTELTCSDTAPIPVRAGGLRPAADMLGFETITLVGTLDWSEVVEVLPMGMMPVQHITCENGVFLVGNQKGRYMAHHNIKWEPIDP